MCLEIWIMRIAVSNVVSEYSLGGVNLTPRVKPVRTPVAIFGSLGLCIYVPASCHWLISYSPVHLN